MYTREKGLEPIYTPTSKIIVLGSFPSKISRDKQEYYANKGNRFWKEICKHLGIDVPATYAEKVELLKKLNIALWDVIDTCEIDGSKDLSIKNATPNNLQDLIDKTDAKLILLNGRKAEKEFERNFSGVAIPHQYVPSTSGANSRFKGSVWTEALSKVIP